MGVFVNSAELVSMLREPMPLIKCYQGYFEQLNPYKISEQSKSELNQLLGVKISNEDERPPRQALKNVKPMYTLVDGRGFGKKNSYYYWDELCKSLVIERNCDGFEGSDHVNLTARAMNAGLIVIRKPIHDSKSIDMYSPEVLRFVIQSVSNDMWISTKWVSRAIRLWVKNPYIAYSLFRGHELNLKSEYSSFITIRGTRTKSLQTAFRVLTDISHNPLAPPILF